MKHEHSKKVAVALTYEPGQEHAPRVTATGRGWLAEQITALAAKHEVAIHKDPALAHVLAELEIGEMIPRELYVVVAGILHYIYQSKPRCR
jgi:flagellar biosynthesis protein